MNKASERITSALIEIAENEAERKLNKNEEVGIMENNNTKKEELNKLEKELVKTIKEDTMEMLLERRQKVNNKIIEIENTLIDMIKKARVEKKQEDVKSYMEIIFNKEGNMCTQIVIYTDTIFELDYIYIKLKKAGIFYNDKICSITYDIDKVFDKNNRLIKDYENYKEDESDFSYDIEDCWYENIKEIKKNNCECIIRSGKVFNELSTFYINVDRI